MERVVIGGCQSTGFLHPSVADRLRPRSTGSIPIGIDKCNKKIVIATIKNLELFRIKNEFTHDSAPKDSIH
jgi:hypothetical protein